MAGIIVADKDAANKGGRGGLTSGKVSSKSKFGSIERAEGLFVVETDTRVG